MGSIPSFRADFNPHANGHTNGASHILDAVRKELQELEHPSEVHVPIVEAVQEGNDGDLLFRILTPNELDKLPPKRWLIKGIISPGELGMVFGPSNSGKSFNVIDMIFSACLGRDFAGQFNVAAPLNVVYVAGEGLEGIPQRFMVAAKHYGVALNELSNLRIILDMPQLYNQSDPRNPARFIEEYTARADMRPDQLFIDTMQSASTGADEYSSQHMGQVIHQLKAIARRLGCAIILIHHSSKSGDNYRGSSALHGAMDIMVQVTGSENPRTMSCYKAKDSERWKPLKFNVKRHSDIDSCCVEWGAASEGRAGESKGNPDGRKTDTARRVLGLLYEEYEQLRNGEQEQFSLRVLDVNNTLGTTTAAKALKKLEELGLVQSAPEDVNGAPVTYWFITAQGIAKWESIRDDESILI